MRILHTADWHLNDRLGRISRQGDIVARMEEVAEYLDEYKVDVLLVAGDLFSEYTRLDEVQGVVADLTRVFKPYLMRGGTMVAISGNHDNAALFNVLRYALDLADPLDPKASGARPPGRLYLAAQPTYLLLADNKGQQVQFALMPYPTVAGYLRDEDTEFTSHEQKNRLLHGAMLRKLAQMQDELLDPRLHSVLVAHAHVRGSHVSNLKYVSEHEDIIFEPGDIPTHWAYVGLGHVHKPQALSGAAHVRYSGSIDRFDYGERDEEKGVVLVDIGPDGRIGEPQCLPLQSTPIYEVEILDPQADMAGLRERYPDAERALVKVKLVYRPGHDNRDALCQELESVFPRWYRREIVASGAETPGTSISGPGANRRDVPATVRAYLQSELEGHSDREAVLEALEQLFDNSEVHL